MAAVFTAVEMEEEPPPPPVEYAVAVDRYLDTLRLGEHSRRVYRIALATWAWPLVDRTPPPGRARRGATPPIVPLAVLDDPGVPARLRAALRDRAARVDARTLGRELSIVRGALAWWRAQGWIRADLTGALRTPAQPQQEGQGLTPEQVSAVFALPAGLREQTFWHLLYESGAPVDRVLALNVHELDLPRRRERPSAASAGEPIRWGSGTARLLPLLLVGRTAGPLFLTERRASPATPARDVCPVTGRRRLSYRRAAELFTAATKPLDPAGRGWTLRDLRQAGRSHLRPRPGETPGTRRGRSG
jgi:integrase/recombinase XerD